ncbi:MAG: hypothetical protein KBC69_01785 [Candidatus Magasanikbacteria bacterium]|nr:hypothetical protein [Candidatus Magasanikbacteria bacterium]
MSLKRLLVNFFRQGFLITLEILWFLVIRFVYKPDFVFLVYGDERHKRACWPKFVERIIGLLGLIGFLRFKSGHERRRGLILATTKSREEIVKNPHLALEIVREVESRFPSAVIALAGQLPGWIVAASKAPPVEPCVTGMLGTCYTVLNSVREAIIDRLPEREDGRAWKSVVVAVIGGAGHTGSEVVRLLAREECVSCVIALDPRYGYDEREGKLLKTSNSEILAQANLAVVLTGKGDDAKAAIEQLKHGVVVLDDTHPMMGREMVESLRAKLAGVCKITSKGEGKGLRYLPLLPDFKQGDIPGCLLEALVVSVFGRSSLVSYGVFEQRARFLGITPNLGQHPRF